MSHAPTRAMILPCLALAPVCFIMFLASLQLTWLRKAGWKGKNTYERIWVGVLWAAGAGWEVYGYADLSVGRHGWAEAVTTMTRLKNGMSQVSVLCHAHGEKADARSHFPYICLIDLLSLYQCTFYIFRNDKRCDIRVDRLCCFHPLLQNLRNGWLKLFVVVLVPVQYVYSVYYTISTNDVPKAFGMFVRDVQVMPFR